MTFARLLVLIALAGATGRAPASALTAINATRSAVCLRVPSATPLTENPQLDAAADQLARGRSLHEVLNGLAERPAYAAAIRLPGAYGDAAIEHAAAAKFCKDLAAPGLREVGLARREGDLWVIVTQPVVDLGHESERQAALEVLRTVNQARTRGQRCGPQFYAPVAPVTLSAALSAVAFDHSVQMAADDALVHEGRDASTAAIRVHRARLPARHVGENIASGVPTGAEVIAGWLASPSHCSVIMDPRFSEMGVSYALRPRSSSVIFWTQLFTEPP